MNQDSIQTTPLFAATLSQLTHRPSEEKPHEQPVPLPSWTDTVTLLDDLRALLLMVLDPDETEKLLTRAVHTLKSQLNICTLNGDTDKLVNEFLIKLVEIRHALQEDIETALQGDPAVTCPDEVVLCYPGLRALACYRIAHALYRLDVPLLPRLMTEIAHSITGIDIHPGAKLGRRFFIDHGTGVVIGETCIIGDDVKIYQGVTLGARSFPKSGEGHIIKGLERHPIIGDRVTIYAGATILGRTHIGSDSVIGGNVWITKDVPAMSNVVQQRPKQEKFIHGAGI